MFRTSIRMQTVMQKQTGGFVVIKSIIKALLLGCLTGSTLITTALAGPIGFVPSGLNPGDHYRLAFVTHGTTNAMSSDINYYNNFVTNEALNSPELAALGATWTALVSTSSVDARDNTHTDPNPIMDGAGTPIYSLGGDPGGDLIASNNYALWDTENTDLSHPIVIDSTFIYNDDFVWTGTGYDGIKSAPLGTISPADFGLSTATDQQFVISGEGPNSADFALYGISSDLIVPGSPIPAPPTWTLLGFGLVCFALISRRRAPGGGT